MHGLFLFERTMICCVRWSLPQWVYIDRRKQEGVAGFICTQWDSLKLGEMYMQMITHFDIIELHCDALVSDGWTTREKMFGVECSEGETVVDES